AAMLWPMLLLTVVAALAGTIAVRPRILDNYRAYPMTLVIPLVVFAALIAMRAFLGRGSDSDAFLASAAFLVAMLAGAAAAQYPVLLPSSSDPGLDLKIADAAAGPHSLRIGLIWWTAGMLLAVAYTVFIYRSFRGKVTEEQVRLP